MEFKKVFSFRKLFIIFLFLFEIHIYTYYIWIYINNENKQNLFYINEFILGF